MKRVLEMRGIECVVSPLCPSLPRLPRCITAQCMIAGASEDEEDVINRLSMELHIRITLGCNIGCTFVRLMRSP